MGNSKGSTGTFKGLIGFLAICITIGAVIGFIKNLTSDTTQQQQQQNGQTELSTDMPDMHNMSIDNSHGMNGEVATDVPGSVPATTPSAPAQTETRHTTNTCRLCHGTGNCHACGGTGSEVAFGNTHTTVCRTCGGSTKCKSCNGQGTYNTSW